MLNTRYLWLFLGPCVAAGCVWGLDVSPAPSSVAVMLGITLWVAIWWLTEVVDMAVTSLLPLVLLPVLGILDAKVVASQYMDHIIFLFIGGFIISFALEKQNLHRRLALGLLSWVGRSPSLILAGVMATAFLISMWMSNTATTLMLYPAVMAISEQIWGKRSEADRLGVALLLGLAYSASIGGTATLVGTPTNMIFYSFFQSAYPERAGELSFASWFEVAFPMSVLLGVFTFGVLWYFFVRGDRRVLDRAMFGAEYARLGRLGSDERKVAAVFVLTVVLWFTRADIDLGFVQLRGWSRLFSNPLWIQDSTVAIAMALVLFVLPSVRGGGERLLEWRDVQGLPFGIVLLFGAGFALAKGFEVSGLSSWLAGKLNFLVGSHPIVLIGGICVVICVISEFASNVASIQLALPILMALQKTLGVEPELLMIPATLAASLGFMLPVATAPNTIVFGSGKVHVRDMLKAGLLVDIGGILIITLVAMLMR